MASALDSGDRSIIELYRDGDLTFLQATHSLMSELGELESEIRILVSDLERRKEVIRHELYEILKGSGHDVTEIKGIGKAEAVPAFSYKSYDKKLLDRLVMILQTTDNKDLADEILACRVDNNREGFLRVTMEKVKK